MTNENFVQLAKEYQELGLMGINFANLRKLAESMDMLDVYRKGLEKGNLDKFLYELEKTITEYKQKGLI